MIHALLDFLRTLTTPDRLIHLLSTVLSGWLGYATLTAIVFAETGLLVGFVLPGDSLLFTIGVVAGAGELNLTIIIVLLIAACLAGDYCGYLLGRRTGPAIFNRPDSRFFKQEYLQRTNAFYEKHGGKTIIYAKFVPVIRTFAPFVAAELWEQMGGTGVLFRQKWPEADAELARENEIEIPIQVNGKLVNVIKIAAESDEEAMRAAAMADEKVAARLAGKTIVKVIVVRGKLVNFVVK